MLRGDDIAALQSQLGGLGFDSGRVDGIFGPDTQAGLEEFQRNAGLTVDGICGPATMAALRRLGGHCRAAEPVAGIREEERRQAAHSLGACRLVVAHRGGLGALARATAGALAHGDAKVTVVGHPDSAAQAHAANGWGADVFIGLEFGDEPGASTAYFKGTHWHSETGRKLAAELQAAVTECLGLADLGVRGMAVPALRETKMPAVICAIAPARVIVEGGEEVAGAVVSAVSAWLQT